ncbi:MAG: hypothetical protein H0T67_08040 [Burkholderiaceae bacterium]|nr:hypothetical protein [Burkholderiaceae bacterium]
MASIAAVTDNETFWPSIESVKAEMLELERAGRIAKHYKYCDGAMDASERFFRAKELAAEQDKARTWRRR